ncbi:hypothetical protein HanIR_Chr04g0170261 [Helianthus annuus]|nr:hypothetical protein HanIR_Chr04g0170261 [Helianthus annuus]
MVGRFVIKKRQKTNDYGWSYYYYHNKQTLSMVISCFNHFEVNQFSSCSRYQFIFIFLFSTEVIDLRCVSFNSNFLKLCIQILHVYL